MNDINAKNISKNNPAEYEGADLAPGIDGAGAQLDPDDLDAVVGGVQPSDPDFHFCILYLDW